jgi:hypothetical protein
VRVDRGGASARQVLGPLLEHLAERSQRELPSAMQGLRELTAGPQWPAEDDDVVEGEVLP